MVVGYVHTASGSAALRWAALEAARIGAELEVVHVFDVDRRADASLAADMDEVRRNAARRADHRARVALDETGADVRVRFTAAEGTLEDVLAAAARGCGRLVLGEPGGHEDATMPARLGARCQVPVTVVSESGEPHQVTPEVTPEP
jgi:dihydrodipicolinate reductase